jgi:riboflavin synthase
MFTGLVEGVGRIRRADRRAGDMVLSLEPLFPMDGVRTGDSLCVSGVCLTVTGLHSGALSTDVSAETLSRSTLGSLGAGDRVNLERALRLSDRLGGHLVSGHVDCVGRIRRKEPRQGSWFLEVEFDPAFSRYAIEKGSIALDGVSLTINRCSPGRVEMNIIPQTGRDTTLLEKAPGAKVNVETDLIGKYVERLMSGGEEGRAGKPGGGISLESLSRHGFLK